jgi:hypothetical protein
MRVRLIRKLADVVDGIDLRGHQAGDVLDLRTADAGVLLAEGWATPARRAADLPVEPQRTFRVAASPILSAGAHAAEPCSKCGSDQVKVALATDVFVYYRCLACQQAWAVSVRDGQPTQAHMPERRRAS